MNIVITGSTKGIGKAVTDTFAPLASSLFLTARTLTDLQDQQDELQRSFPDIKIFIFQADFSLKKEVESFGDFVNQHCSNVDILVNNAGFFNPGSLMDEDEGLYELTMATNVTSAYALCRKLVPAMKNVMSGYIFNMCSVASLKAYPNGGSYSISKFALLGFTKNLRDELIPFKIKVTAVIPGATWTQSWAGSGQKQERLMEVNDIAQSMLSAYHLSPTAVVEEIISRPLEGDL